MSHELDMTKAHGGFAHAHGSEKAWHGLGSMAPEGATLEQWLELAGLDFAVECVPVAFKPNGHWKPADDHRAIIRKNLKPADLDKPSHGHLFQIASDIFKPLQPRECADFIFGLTASHGMATETMGSLHGGATIWGLAHNNKGITLPGNDLVRPYLLSTTSYDSSRSRTWKFIMTRVVCDNTLTIGMGESGGIVKIRNTSVHNADEVRQRLGLIDDMSAAFELQAQRLVGAKPTRAQVNEMLLKLFGKPADPDKPLSRDNLSGHSRNVLAEVETCVVSSPGSGLPSAAGTAWGALNGVTHYVDHKARARSQDNRLASAWFGKGDAVKTSAMSWLLQECCNMTVSSTLDDVLAATVQ